MERRGQLRREVAAHHHPRDGVRRQDGGLPHHGAGQVRAVDGPGRVHRPQPEGDCLQVSNIFR